MDNDIILPTAPDIDHVTPEIIPEWIRLPEFVGNKSKWVTRIGQIVVQRDRVSESENGYTFLDYERGLTLFRYDYYGTFYQELSVIGDNVARKLFHEVMLAVASNLSRLTDYARFDDFTREQKRELGERAKETVRLVLAEFDGHSAFSTSTYDESHDVILNEPEEEVEKFACVHCEEDFAREDLSEMDVSGEVELLCVGCRGELHACDECGYTSFSEHIFNMTDGGDLLCDDCYREATETTCDECGETSSNENDFEDYNGMTLCRTCVSKAERAADDWTPATWLRKHEFEENEMGFIVYKSFGKYYPPPEEWNLTKGSIIESDVENNLDVTCGYGVNVGSFAWVRGNSWRPENTWKCLLHYSDVETTVIPYTTDGKFRVARLELLHKVNRNGNRLADKGYTEEDDNN